MHKLQGTDVMDEWHVFAAIHGLGPAGEPTYSAGFREAVKAIFDYTDWTTAREAFHDMKESQPVGRTSQHVPIKRFRPGDHFYAYGERFDTLQLAREHIKSKGDIPGRVVIIDARLGLA